MGWPDPVTKETYHGRIEKEEKTTPEGAQRRLSALQGIQVMKRIHRLSKSRFVAGLHCERRLWLLVNRPEERREPTRAEIHRMEFGTTFGRDVTKLFEYGEEITADHRHPKQALNETTEKLGGKAPALFEAAFLHHEVLIRADILERSESKPNAWNLIEVKSSSNSESSRKKNLKKYTSDMAVQLDVLEGAAKPIGVSTRKPAVRPDRNSGGMEYLAPESPTRIDGAVGMFRASKWRGRRGKKLAGLGVLIEAPESVSSQASLRARS